MHTRALLLLAVVVPTTLIPRFALADPIVFTANVEETSRQTLDFSDGSRRHVALVQRHGKAGGQNPLAGAEVSEVGLHDIIPNVSVDTIFYHAFKLPSGDAAYIKSTFRGVTVVGSDGKAKNALSGLWEVVSASGGLRGLRGAGTVHLKSVSKTERQFTFSGDISAAAKVK